MNLFAKSLALTFFVSAASLSSAAVTFLASDGNKLYRADSTGATFGFVTLSAPVQSLTRLPAGIVMPNAAAGDIIACARNPVSGRYPLFKVNDPLGAASLTQIGSLDQGIGSLTFANGEMFGVEDSINPLRVIKLSPATGNTITNYNTGISSGGGGGLAYSASSGLFFITDATNHRLYSWGPGGSSTLVGGIGFNFSNNGMEFHEGTLYGALRRDTPANTMALGYFNTTTGAFTTQATLTGIGANGTGFLAVPEPVSLTALTTLILARLRRRRKS